jgi:hypothetical protein
MVPVTIAGYEKRTREAALDQRSVEGRVGAIELCHTADHYTDRTAHVRTSSDDKRSIANDSNGSSAAVVSHETTSLLSRALTSPNALLGDGATGHVRRSDTASCGGAHARHTCACALSLQTHAKALLAWHGGVRIDAIESTDRRVDLT